MTPPVRGNADARRLAAVRRYGILHTPPEQVFDDLTTLAAQVCEAPAAAICFADERRQWCKSSVGVAARDLECESSLARHVLLTGTPLVLADASTDAAFARDPIVAGGAAVRLYAGAPLVTPAGEAIGTLAVMDPVPRQLPAARVDALRALARQVVAQLELRRRTTQLAGSERLLRAIVESEPECVKLLAPDGTVRMMNRAGLRMLEAESLREIEGRGIHAFVHEPDRPAFAALIRDVLRGRDRSLEFQVLGLKGRRRWMETHAVPLREESGSITAVLAITHDVTERKLADAALRESERKFRTLFEEAIDGIVVADANGRVRDVNTAACDMTGYSREQLLRMSASDLVVPEQVADVAPAFAQLSTGERITTEWNIVRADGSRFVAEVTAKQLADGRVQAFARDVTARTRAEAALREAEERLRRAVQAGRVGLWDWDLRAATVHYSPEWKRQIGYEEHELSNTYEEWRDRVHPEDLPRVIEQVRWFLEGDAADHEAEFRFRHRDGSYRLILSQASKVTGADGATVRVVGSHVDVTERADLQAQLLHAQKLESIGRLAGGIAHDFNNLLTVMNGLADDAIVRLYDPASVRHDLEQIRLAGNKATALTRQLLSLSRPQTRRPEVLSIHAVVAEMHGMLRRVIGVDVELVLRLSEDIDLVKVDRSQIEQVIMNLVVNARDAMPGGGTLTIGSRAAEMPERSDADMRPGGRQRAVLLTIADTGIGMDEATRKRIFEPFFTTKDVGKGTGLGLPTVNGIVTQSGGRIEVQSAPGRGTTFLIYLPQVEAQPDPAPAAAAGVDASGSETILLVEDDAGVRDLARRTLQSAGYTVLEAASGAEALAALERFGATVHLMLTDVVMPGMNGRALAAKTAAVRPEMKTLFMSGYTDDPAVRRGSEDEARFLAKPFTAAQLKQKVRAALDVS